MFKNVVWLGGLLFVDLVEFLKGAKEMLTAASLAPACRKHGTQLIHVHFASRSLTAGILLGRLIDAPVSCTAHAFDLWLRSPASLRYRLKHCIFIATISRFNLEFVREKLGAEIADRCRVVHCGIDTAEFTPAGRSVVPGRILLVSRLKEQKGHRVLVEACGILAQRGVGFECLLIGLGPERNRIESQINALGLQERVQLLGAVANDQLKPYLASSAVFALPAVVAADGDQDGIPVALMEAMACGLPVVSTPVSGIPELLRDGEAGRLVPPGDAVSLADALEELLNDPASVERLGRSGRQAVVEEFDIGVTSRRLRMLFADALQLPSELPPASEHAASHPCPVDVQNDAGTSRHSRPLSG
jgi:glycosyltransferase involved in cell wall biosynthesis